MDVEEGVERYLFAHIHDDVLAWIASHDDPESAQEAERAQKDAQRAARRDARRRSTHVGVSASAAAGLR